MGASGQLSLTRRPYGGVGIVRRPGGECPQCHGLPCRHSRRPVSLLETLSLLQAARTANSTRRGQVMPHLALLHCARSLLPWRLRA